MRCIGFLLSLLCAAAALGAQPDLAILVRQSIANQDRDWREGIHWRYTQADTNYSGDVKHIEVSEVIPLFGTPYERLIAKDGHALSPDEEKREEHKYQKALDQRQKESAAERAARVKKYQNERSFLKDLPNAYDFALLGEEAVDGRPAWIVGMTRRAGFTPATSRGSMLKHLEGKLWIDKQDVQWAKAEAHVIDPIGIGWILARVGPGAEIHLSLTRVAEGLWMPASVEVTGGVKVLMVHRKKLDEQVAFSEYVRSEKDTGVHVSGGHAPANVPTKGSFR